MGIGRTTRKSISLNFKRIRPFGLTGSIWGKISRSELASYEYIAQRYLSEFLFICNERGFVESLPATFESPGSVFMARIYNIINYATVPIMPSIIAYIEIRERERERDWRPDTTPEVRVVSWDNRRNRRICDIVNILQALSACWLAPKTSENWSPN